MARRTKKTRKKTLKLQEFHLFSRLPTEIRHVIWRMSFNPVILEVSAKRHHKCKSAEDEERQAKSRIRLAGSSERCSYNCRHDIVDRVFSIPVKRTPLLHICKDSRAIALSLGIRIINADTKALKGNDSSQWDIRGIEPKKDSDGNVLEEGRTYEAKSKGGRMNHIDANNDIIFIGYHDGITRPGYGYNSMGIFYLPAFVQRLDPFLLSRIRFLAIEVAVWIHLLSATYTANCQMTLSLMQFNGLKELIVVTFGDYGYREGGAIWTKEFVERSLQTTIEQLHERNPGWEKPNYRLVEQVRYKRGFTSLLKELR